MGSKNSARRVVLNLIRVAPGRVVPVQRLIEIGELFGFKANAVRVAVTRLAADGLLESDERGSYRLGPSAGTMSAHVEAWRKGEARMRPWKRAWLAVALMPKPNRRARAASLSALARLGMREGFAGLWVRPDNLRQGFDESVEQLRAFGLEEGAEALIVERLGERLAQRLTRDVWPTTTLERSQRGALKNLERSLERIEDMPPEGALVESFLVGGEAIRVLATDPLLPPEMMPSDTRAQLTETMLKYDTIGHRLWKRFATGPRLCVVQGVRDAS